MKSFNIIFRDRVECLEMAIWLAKLEIHMSFQIWFHQYISNVKIIQSVLISAAHPLLIHQGRVQLCLRAVTKEEKRGSTINNKDMKSTVITKLAMDTLAIPENSTPNLMSNCFTITLVDRTKSHVAERMYTDTLAELYFLRLSIS